MVTVKKRRLTLITEKLLTERLSHCSRREVLEAYLGGESATSIADRLGVSSTSVSAYIRHQMYLQLRESRPHLLTRAKTKLRNSPTRS